MAKLTRLTNITDSNVLRELFNNEILVYEDIQGSKIWVQFAKDGVIIKPKSINSEPINLVDMAMQKYYQKALDFLTSLEPAKLSLLNSNWWFCFEYFPDEQPANIQYNRIPKNNLILTSIFKRTKFDFNFDEIVEYSNLIGVDPVPVIYQGYLSPTMIEGIMYFIHTSEQDLEYIFGERSFASFFYKLLNPALGNSFLCDDYNNNLERLIIMSNSMEMSFELLNPFYSKISVENSTDYVENYTLLLINFLNYCQILDLESVKFNGDSKDEMYLDFICKLFNYYIGDNKEDLISFEFNVPEFFDKEKFKINTALIKNELTREYISMDAKFEYIFKIILGSFNKKRKKSIGLFTDITVGLFNQFVDDINRIIEYKIGLIDEIELTRTGLLDFGKYLDLKYDVDGEGKVYPDVYKDFEKGFTNPKSKDKKGSKN